MSADLFIVPAEVRRDISNPAGNNTVADRGLSYAPTTLVMVFPPGELNLIRQLINDSPEENT